MLSSVDEIISHVGVYDPVARRQRYLRDRQLKGRAPGQQPQSGGGQSGGGGNNAPTPPVKTIVASVASNARQVAALRGRLVKLKAALQKLLADAKSSSSSSSKKDSTSTKDTKSEPKTAKQKAAAKEALKKAQKERAKDQAKEPDKPKEPSKEEKIAHLRSVISDVESQLRAALDKARNQTASNGR